MKTTLKRYRYAGPHTGKTFRRKGEPPLEVVFADGGEVAVPEDDPYVRELVRIGRLTEPKIAAKPEAAKADEKPAAAKADGEGKRKEKGA